MEALLEEQQRYYDARANEYDEWWERRGRYDLGVDGNQGWRDEAERIRTILTELALDGDMLELAGGTGIWTEFLAQRAARVTVLDGSLPMLERNKRRQLAAGLLGKVEFQNIDLFQWKPTSMYDAIFAGFWISHVPVERLDTHFGVIASAVKPGGLFLILEGQADRSRSELQGTSRPGEDIEVRTLNDGSSHRIVKRELDPADLAARLTRAGFQPRIEKSIRQFQLAIARKE